MGQELQSAKTGRRRPRHDRFRAGGETVLALIAFSGVSLVYMRPFWRRFRDHVTPDVGDPLFNLYVLEWGRYQLGLGLPDLWNAPFFFPLRDALALSDHLIGLTAQAWVLGEIGATPVGIYNLLLLSALPLSAAATFWCLRQAGASRLAGVAGGLAFAFSPYHWSQLSHLQVFTVQWIPPVIWYWYRLLRRPRLRYAVPFLVFYSLHVTGGSYLAYMIHVPLAAVAASLLPSWRRWLAPGSRRILALAVVAAAAVTAAVFAPYLTADHELETSWGSENYRVFGATSVALLTPSTLNPYFESFARVLRPIARGYEGDAWFAEKNLYPGLLPGVLALIAVAGLIHRHRVPPAREIAAQRRTALAALAGAAGISFVAADLFTLGWIGGARPMNAKPGDAYIVCSLALAASLAGWWILRRRWGGGPPIRWSAMPPFDRSVLALGAASLALSFPVLYEPLTGLVPGLDRMRVPSRFYTFATLATAFFAARGLDRLRSRLRGRWTIAVVLLVVAAMAVELAPRPLPWHPVSLGAELPPVYRWLAERDDVRALAELPFREGPGELPYMVYSTAHWRPLVNGYSSRLPPAYLVARETCSSALPEPPCLELLRELGVSHVVVHPVWKNPAKHRRFERWKERVERGEVPDSRIAYSEPRGDVVVEIRPTGVGTPATARKIHAADSVP